MADPLPALYYLRSTAQSSAAANQESRSAWGEERDCKHADHADVCQVVRFCVNRTSSKRRAAKLWRAFRGRSSLANAALSLPPISLPQSKQSEQEVELISAAAAGLRGRCKTNPIRE